MIIDTVKDIADARRRGTPAVIGVMARIMAEHARTESSVSEQDLRRAGFSQHEIDAHGAAATALVASRQKAEAPRRRDAIADLVEVSTGLKRLETSLAAEITRLKAGLERIAGRVGS